MKARKNCGLGLLLGLCISALTGAQASGITQEQINTIAKAIFNPTLMPYPTTSLNTQAVDALYGPSGLNVGEPLLTYIKNFYFYIEYITHIELAAQLLTVAKDSGLAQFSQAVFSWNDLVASVSKATGAANWQALLPILRKATPDWADFRKALGFTLQHDLQSKFTGTTQPKITFDDLMQTSLWTAFPITANDIITSNLWQNYLKFTIYGTYQIDETLTQSIDFNQNLIFKYIPKIEIGYYERDFTDLRNHNELLRVSYILNESYRNRLKNQTLDWKDLTTSVMLTQAQNFTNDEFHKIASAATDVSLAGKNPYSPYTVDAQGAIRIKSPITLPSPYPEYMTCLAMIMMLQKLTYSLFEPKGTNVDALTNTIKVLRAVKTRPLPSFIVYEEEDYLPLEDLTTVIRLTAERQAALAPAPAVTTQSLEQPVISTPTSHDESVETANFIEAVGGLINDIEDIAESSWATVVDIANVVADEAEVFYYSSGLANIISHVTPEEAQQLSEAARAAEDKDWDKFKEDSDKVIRDAVQLGTWPGRTIIDTVLGLIDEGFAALGLPETDLEGDYNKFVDKAIDVMVDTLVTARDIFLIPVEAGFKLAEDGAALLTHVALDIVTFQTQNLGADILQGVYNIVSDTISTFLEAVEVLIEDLSKFVKDVLAMVANLVQFLTDCVIDIITFGTEVSAALSCGNRDICDPAAITQETAQFLESHKSTISQIVTTGLLIAATVATGGGALAIGMMAGFGAFSIVGGYQADQDAIDVRAEQKAFLDDFTAYLVNKEQTIAQQQQFMTDELGKKLGAELNNRERSLGFYQNYLNDTLSGIRNQLNSYIGSWQAALLKPQKSTNLVYADVGSLYGYSTGFYDMNISQGFSLYSAPRQTIAQEIAETPKHMITNPDSEGTAVSDTKFWFNQRITKDLDKESNPLEVEIRFHTIYLLDNFYVGLYIGGSPLDKNAILQKSIGNLDQPHLAKMFVYSKEGKDQPITLGLYEFETNQPTAQRNWLATNLQGPIFAPGVWYHMKAQLGGNALLLKVWQEGEQEPTGQSFTITPCPQQTFGMIFSGAAGEFQVISPQQTFTASAEVRPPITSKTEKIRELDARLQMQRLLMPPKFSTFNMTPMNTYEIIKGHYLYQLLQDTIPDYVTTGNYEDSNLVNIGQAPTYATTALVSLVTGKGYENVNNKLQEHGWAMNIGTVYRNTFVNLSDDVQKKIDTALATYTQTMMGTPEGFAFGTLKLTPVSQALVQNHQFVYLPIGNGPTLKYQNTPLTDGAGAPLYDSYFVFTLLTNNAPDFTVPTNNVPDTGSYYAGMSYQDIKPTGQKLNKPVCMLSLMTGNVYVENHDDPIAMGYYWEQYVNQLPADLQKKINDGKAVFNAAYLKATKTSPEQNKTDTKKGNTTTNPTGGGTDSSTSGMGYNGGGSGSQTTDDSMNKRQTDAGDDEFGT